MLLCREGGPVQSVGTTGALLTLLTLATELVFVSSAGSSFREEGERVHATLPGFGPIVGTKEKSLKGNTYYAFKGLPYSKAGRFQDFAPPQPWTEVLDATKYSPSCMSVFDSDAPTSEDCMYANVYTTNLNFTEPNVPVLAVIHGGGFVALDGRLSPLYFMDQKIVVVTFNYRLGPFGFLFTYDPLAGLTGNYGLKDQIHALRWINQTVSTFGGNSKDVTLFGISSGAASVHWLMLIPQETQGLFHKAITMSGSALSPWAVQANPNLIIRRFAKAIGCLPQTQYKMNPAAYQCLRTANAFSMSKLWFNKFAVWAGQPYTLVPAIDGTLIRGHPRLLLQEGKFLHIPWLGSLTKDEGALAAGGGFVDITTIANMELNWVKLCPTVMAMDNLDPDDAGFACITALERYIGSEQITILSYGGFIKMAGDRHFNIPMQMSIELHSGHAPFFGYRYDYHSPSRAQNSGKYYNVDPTRGGPGFQPVVFHADDNTLVMPFEKNMKKIVNGDRDEKVHRMLIEIYTSFINSGVPKLPSDLKPAVEFPKFSASSLNNILVIDETPRLMTNYSAPKEIAFWNALGLG